MPNTLFIQRLIVSLICFLIVAFCVPREKYTRLAQQDKDRDSLQAIVRIHAIKSVEIIRWAYKVHNDSNLYHLEMDECRDWQLTKQDAIQLILRADVVSSEASHMSFGWRPCWYEGIARINDSIEVEVEINAAATGYLYRDSVFQYLTWPTDNAYFITGQDKRD
jgi:hypothetical protein